MLEIYCRAFSTVEVDSTFYAIPSESSIRNWVRRTPADFVFALKFPREVTHELMFRGDSIRILNEFCDRVSDLGSKLACILIQTPPMFEPDAGNIEAFDSFVRQLPDSFRFSVEFRNRRWLNQQIIDLLRPRNIAVALVQGEWLGDQDIRWIAANPSSDFFYIRWMGARDLTKFDKVQRPQDQNLQRWVHLIEYLRSRSSDVYAYFSNFYEGQAVASANKLKELMQIEVTDPVEFDDQLRLFS